MQRSPMPGRPLARKASNLTVAQLGAEIRTTTWRENSRTASRGDSGNSVFFQQPALKRLGKRAAKLLPGHQQTTPAAFLRVDCTQHLRPHFDQIKTPGIADEAVARGVVGKGGQDA